MFSSLSFGHLDVLHRFICYALETRTVLHTHTHNPYSSSVMASDVVSLFDLDSGADTFILSRSYSFTDLLWILSFYRDINVLTDVLTGSFIVLSCPVMKIQTWSFYLYVCCVLY